MKAIITSGGNQFVVAKGDTIEVERLDNPQKTISFEPLMLFDDKKSTIGTPVVKGASVKAKVIGEIRDDKVTSIRFKAKKRVHKRRGHRQLKTRLEITDISQ